MKKVSELIDLYFKLSNEIKEIEDEIGSLTEVVKNKPTGSINGVLATIIDKHRSNTKRLDEILSRLDEKMQKFKDCHVELVEAFELIGRKNIIVSKNDTFGNRHDMIYSINEENKISAITSL